MTRFRFPLARLLSIRERRERDAAVSLAAAQAAEGALRATFEMSQQRRVAARAELTPPAGTSKSVAELQNVAFLVEQLDVRTKAVAGQLDAAKNESTKLHTTLVERVRERRVLERLRDRQMAEWRVAQDRVDREEMDAVAQARRRNDDANPLF